MVGRDLLKRKGWIQIVIDTMIRFILVFLIALTELLPFNRGDEALEMGLQKFS